MTAEIDPIVRHTPRLMALLATAVTGQEHTAEETEITDNFGPQALSATFTLVLKNGGSLRAFGEESYDDGSVRLVVRANDDNGYSDYRRNDYLMALFTQVVNAGTAIRRGTYPDTLNIPGDERRYTEALDRLETVLRPGAVAV